MSRIKINFLFGRREKKQIEAIEFSEIENYIEGIKSEKKISEYYDKLNDSYEKIMKRLEEAKKSLKKLESKGEKKFTSLVIKNLERIKEVEELNIPSLQQFYTNTFYIIDKIVKIPPQIQYEALEYEEGKEAVKLLNSFLKDVGDLKKILAMRYGEYSTANHLENASKKYKEVKKIMEDIKHIEDEIQSVIEEKEDAEKLLEEGAEALKHISSRIDTKEVMELRKHINSLDAKLVEISSDLKLRISRARRPISKILHSKDKKMLDFFHTFMKYPLENINEKFWKIVDTIRTSDVELNKDENRTLNEFLIFVDHELKKNIDEYNKLEEEKRQISGILKKVSSRNERLLENVENEKKDLEEKVRAVNKKLEKLKKARNNLQHLLRKNIKILEIMIKKAGGNRIKIKI